MRAWIVIVGWDGIGGMSLSGIGWEGRYYPGIFIVKRPLPRIPALSCDFLAYVG